MIVRIAALLLLVSVSAFAQVGGAPTPTVSVPVGAAVNVLSFGATANASANWSATNAANKTAIGNAIAAAQSAGLPLYFPAPTTGGACYNYTAPLTISANLKVYGDWAAGNWAGSSSIDVPSGSPPLGSSILCPTANGSDGIDISGTALDVDFRDVGILFQTTFGQSSTTTGDGIHYIPSGTSQGLSGSYWQNVVIYGHDGNHYCVNLQNAILSDFNHVQCFGGGGWNLAGSSSTQTFGNLHLTSPYVNVLVGGTAYGFNFTASQASALNLVYLDRPQANVNNITATPAGNPPTSAQYIWHEDGNATAIRIMAGDLETNVSSGIQLGLAGEYNDMQWNGLFTDAAFINSPGWDQVGLRWGPVTKTFNDTSDNGSITGLNQYALTSDTITSTSAITVGQAATLIVAAPVCSTNVTCTRISAIYSQGEIFSTSDMGSSGGAFFSGTINLNKSQPTSATEIGDGTATGLVTIGGTGNLVSLGGSGLTTSSTTGFPEIPSIAGKPTSTVSVTSGHVAIIYDSSDNELCITAGAGTWKCSPALSN
jgi:hypothetical protein